MNVDEYNEHVKQINSYLKLIAECDQKVATLCTLKLRLQNAIKNHQQMIGKLN